MNRTNQAAVALLALIGLAPPALAQRAVLRPSDALAAPRPDGPINPFGPVSEPPRVVEIGPVEDGWVAGPGGLERVTVRFDQRVVGPPAFVRVFDNDGDEILAFTAAIGTTGDELEIEFAPPIHDRRVRVVVDYSLQNDAGLALDGEVASPFAPTLPSGDGSQGGQAVFAFNVLAGDATRDGVIDDHDGDAILASLGAGDGDPGFDPNADVNRDGFVNVLDVATWANNFGASLPPTDGAAPTAALTEPDPAGGLVEPFDRLEVAFNEPVGPGAISNTALHLTSEADGSLVVPTSVAPAADGLSAEFVLGAPLDETATYRVRVTNAIADVSGELLDANSTLFTLAPLGQRSIFPSRTFPLGLGPRSADSGDLNNDGIRDIVAVNQGDDTLSSLLGAGDGTFAPQRVFPTGMSPRWVTLGDYDGDGFLDAAVALEGEDALQILLGDGGGGFSVAVGERGGQTIPVGVSPVFADIGDLDNDKDLDLIVVNKGSDTLSVLLNDGGVFAPAPTVGTGIDPSAVAVDDLTGDGVPDLAVTTEGDDTLTVFVGEGDGTFGGARGGSTFPTGASPAFADIGDLDNDKDLDLIVANRGDNTLTRYLNDGAGGLLVEPSRGVGQIATFPVGTEPVYAALGFLDADAGLDVVSANRGGDSLTTLLNSGDADLMTGPTVATGDMPEWSFIGDLNGDGVADLATVVSRDGVTRPGALSVLLRGQGGPPAQQRFPAGDAPAAVAVGDIDGDDIDDAVVANRDDGTITVYFGSAADGLVPGPTIAVGSEPVDVAIADLAGDAEANVVVATSGEVSELVLFTYNGEGGLSERQRAELPGPPTAIAVGDFLQFIGAGPEIAAVGFFDEMTYYALELKSGDYLPVDGLAIGFAPADVAIADVTGDGLNDVVAVDSGVGFRGFPSDEVVLYQYLGDDVLGSATRFTLGRDGATGIAVGDFNGDETDDLVVVSRFGVAVGRGAVPSEPGEATVIFGDAPKIGLDFGPRVPIGRDPSGVVAIDLNQDGFADFASSNQADDDASLVLGSGQGLFADQQRYAAHVEPSAVAAGDVNGDGAVDLIIANAASDDITLLLGRSGGSR